jgi:hypothetical protein
LTSETYKKLCEAVELVAVEADRFTATEPRLFEWRRWAGGFLGGLYYSKTARRAAVAALAAANGGNSNSLLVPVAKAAALTATAVAFAADGDEPTALAQAAAAREVLQRMDA